MYFRRLDIILLLIAIVGFALILWRSNAWEKFEPAHAYSVALQSAAVFGDRRLELVDTRVNVASASVGELAHHVHATRAELAEFSPDGQWVISADAAGEVRIWSVLDGALRYSIAPSGRVTSVNFAPDGLSFLVARSRRGASLYNWREGQEQRRIEEGGDVWTASFDPTGGAVMTASWDRGIAVWPLNGWPWRQRLEAPSGTPAYVRFTTDGAYLVAASVSGESYLWRRGVDKTLSAQLTRPEYWVVGFVAIMIIMRLARQWARRP